MCGIAGFVGELGEDMSRTAQAVYAGIKHRGPDDQGTWIEGPVALVHSRLAILDLSPEGHQPMRSQSGRFVLVYNGEIYNYLEVRRELDDVAYRGHSDTEVMLAAFERWGVEEAVKRFNGMFAFALWDSRDKVLHLCRDRVGKRPLYYGWTARGFWFGSELKALCGFSGSSFPVNRTALGLLLRHGYIPSPLSIYEGIHKIPPACLLSLPQESFARTPEGFSPSSLSQAKLRPKAYWSPISLSRSAPAELNETAALTCLDSLLLDATRIRMISDVPLGAFLSGGTDSSLVVAAMQKQSSKPVKTYTIGFPEKEFDEAPYARRVAAHLGTEHTELYLQGNEALDVISMLPAMFDEPLADASQIPTYLVSKMARKHVTVILNGDGGDELFAGYNRYVWPKKIYPKLALLPAPLRRAAAKLLQELPQEAWNKALSPFLGAGVQRPGEMFGKLLDAAQSRSMEELYQRLISYWPEPESVVLGYEEPRGVFPSFQDFSHVQDFTARAMYWDLAVYLPDDLLAKVDRAAMAVALEGRSPLLDYRIVEFASKLPLRVKAPGNERKGLLRHLLYRYVPKELVERPKMGFTVPVAAWLRGPLKGWAEDHLSEERLKKDGYLEPKAVRKKWLEHVSGKRNWANQLWSVLSFQSWLAGKHGC